MKEMIEGIFSKEEKTRFLCKVLIDGEQELCYVPSSCKLGQLISLEGEKVWFKPIDSKKSELRYGIYAIKKRRGWVLLNLAETNRVVEAQLSRRIFSYLGKRREIQREKVIEGYKTDLFLPESNMVIEIKTVLTDEAHTLFPAVESERIIKQLDEIHALLSQGYKVCYLIIALNPITTQVEIVEQLKQKYNACISEGMICKGYSLRFEGDTPAIYRQVGVLI